jgi:hypothetical protein
LVRINRAEVRRIRQVESEGVMYVHDINRL